VVFRPSVLPRLLLPYIHDRKESYGCNPTLGLRESAPGRKSLVLEFSSPNIASEFHGKHLRSTILGAHFAKLFESMGWDVIKINYIGDWGKQIGLLGAGWERFGSEDLFRQDPVGHLRNVYAKVDELFQPELEASKKARDTRKDTAEIESRGLYAARDAFFQRMEVREEGAMASWKRFCEPSTQNFISFYRRLNISFDEHSGESKVSSEIMAEVEDLLKRKGICEESNGSWIVDFKKHGHRLGVGIIRGRKGTSTYLHRDLGALLERWRKHSFDKMIYVVASDHDMHFKRLFKIVELMDLPDLASRLQHVHFSKVSKMAEKLGVGSRLGETLDEVEREMVASVRANPAKAAVLGEQAVATMGVNALLAHELASKRTSDHAFDIGSMTSFANGTGPDFQVWYARLELLLQPHSQRPNPTDLSDADLATLEGPRYSHLLRLLAQYPDVTGASYNHMEPMIIVVYLSNVTAQLSSCLTYNQGEGKESEDFPINPAVAALYESARQVLENAMKLLGLTLVSD